MDVRLVEVFQKTYPRSVPNNITVETPAVEAGTVREAQPASPTFDLFSDIERGRDAENIEDIIPQFTPVNAGGFGSESIKGNISEIRSGPAAEITSPVEPLLRNLETPPFHLTELNLDDTVVPEAPGLLDSADKDLSFLNENDSSPGHNDAFIVENLSARTRAVAKYFKDNAVEAQSAESGHISLNKIMEQKNRRQSSRMFFETLNPDQRASCFALEESLRESPLLPSPTNVAAFAPDPPEVVDQPSLPTHTTRRRALRLPVHIQIAVDCKELFEKIMMPEVPIALRLSGHLLLGLVRVYSWKANHLYSDCNRLVTDIRKTFASVSDDLPIGADHAPFESVTLPEIVDLNSLELDQSCDKTHEPDKHLKSHEQITLSDQIPMEAEQYIAISVSEKGRLNLSPQPLTGLNPSSQPTNVLISTPQPTYMNSVSRQLEEDMLPAFERGFESSLSRQENAIFSDNTMRENEETYQNTSDGNNTSQETPGIEKMLCDSDHSSHGLDTPGDIQAGQQSTQSISRRQSLSTIPEDISVPEGGTSHCVENLVNTSANELSFPELESFRIPTPALKPERAPPVKREKVKKRKRIHAFDKQVILSDRQMKKQASNNSNNSNIVSKRRKLPCSDLSVWKFHTFCRKDDIFSTPLLSGMDARLVEVFQKTYPRSVPNNITVETPAVEAGTVREAQPASPTFDLFSDIERGRDAENIEDIIPQFTPVNAGGFGSESIKGNISEIRSGPAVEITSPVEPLLRNLETPPFHLTELNLDDTVVPEAPGLLDSADKDLSFLNENDSSPGHNDAFIVENLSARTRAVAKYFKDNAVEAQSAESGHISLNKILEQKNRRQSSRMFFETLVLKSYDFIRVEQTEAYGDILVSPTPALLCTKF